MINLVHVVNRNLPGDRKLEKNYLNTVGYYERRIAATDKSSRRSCEKFKIIKSS